MKLSHSPSPHARFQPSLARDPPLGKLVMTPTHPTSYVEVEEMRRSLGPILNILSLTREEPGIEEVWQMQQFSNLGSVDPAQIASKWNGNYWNWNEEEFSIPSLGLHH